MWDINDKVCVPQKASRSILVPVSESVFVPSKDNLKMKNKDGKETSRWPEDFKMWLVDCLVYNNQLYNKVENDFGRNLLRKIHNINDIPAALLKSLLTIINTIRRNVFLAMVLKQGNLEASTYFDLRDINRIESIAKEIGVEICPKDLTNVFVNKLLEKCSWHSIEYLSLYKGATLKSFDLEDANNLKNPLYGPKFMQYVREKAKKIEDLTKRNQELEENEKSLQEKYTELERELKRLKKKKKRSVNLSEKESLKDQIDLLNNSLKDLETSINDNG
uniref:Uncharacterized protein n=1 Tax=Parastrongyloides trichosuri TaxID=131310 RepID=A0A0N4ZXQ1_PARTI